MVTQNLMKEYEQNVISNFICLNYSFTSKAHRKFEIYLEKYLFFLIRSQLVLSYHGERNKKRINLFFFFLCQNCLLSESIRNNIRK